MISEIRKMIFGTKNQKVQSEIEDEGDMGTVGGNETSQKTAGLSQEIIDLQASTRAKVELEEESIPRGFKEYRRIWETWSEESKRKMPWPTLVSLVRSLIDASSDAFRHRYLMLILKRF